MKVMAHVMVEKGYGVAIAADQWRSNLLKECEDHNQQQWAPRGDENPELSSEYLNHDMNRAVVTVEFDVPDEAFKRRPVTKVKGHALDI